MLKALSIRNYALIQSLELNPSEHLNIITGETGAGKSIMLGAVGLLLGNRADTKVLFNPEDKCVIEGHFEISEYLLEDFFDRQDLDYESTTIIRREISKAGKSRAFVNDVPVTLDVLKDLGTYLMDIHSQHDNLQLSNQRFQLLVLDQFAGNEALRIRYSSAFKDYKTAEKEYQQLVEEAHKLREEADFFQFQYEELEQAALSADEQQFLEQELVELENAEDIKLKLNQVLSAVQSSEYAATGQLSSAETILRQLDRFGSNYKQLSERLGSALIELEDIAAELSKIEELVQHDPDRIAVVKDRLSLIFSLQQKHRVQSIGSLLDIKESLEQKVEQSQNVDLRIDKKLTEKNDKEALVLDLGTQLSQSRQSVSQKLTEQIKSLLQQLGMPDANFVVSLEKVTPASTGIDDVNFLFSANKGVAPQDIRQVASGGEFSRLMFCFKYILADKTALPTIIFDEIDTGVSGEVAKKMVGMMKLMADNHQVIAISHLPQFAAKGDRHYFVFKDNTQAKTVSKVKELTGDQRVIEIAKMIGGEPPSDSAVQSARELIDG